MQTVKNDQCAHRYRNKLKQKEEIEESSLFVFQVK